MSPVARPYTHVLTRREFLAGSSVATTALALATRAGADAAPEVLQPTRLLGGCTRAGGPAVIPGAVWYEARAERDGLEYRFPAGRLAGIRFLTADLLADTDDLPIFELVLAESGSGPVFTLHYALLPHAEARMRMQIAALSQNRWQFPREGAWLKPMAGGAIVDPARVDRMRVHVLRKSSRPVRWCQTAVAPVVQEPALLATPRLPRGPLLDALGQSAVRVWPGKTADERELVQRLRGQAAAAPAHRWPSDFSRWGGDRTRTVARPATGFFRTHHDGTRWWLADPDGHPFWSTGLDSVRVDTGADYAGLEAALAWRPPAEGPFAAAYTARPDGRSSVNFLAANLVRAFGERWHGAWQALAVGELRRLGFNTVANWSEWEIARAARFPYVRPLAFSERETPFVFRDFPDVFDPRFDADARRFARQLEGTRDDPAFLGYFLMNEPTWGFARQTPAAGMLFNTPACATRTALRAALTGKYGTDAALSSAWGMPVALSQVGEGAWSRPLSAAAERDLADFSAAMAERFFATLSTACRAVDPNHLNLGVRYHTVPPPWALAAMHSFDVFSMNCYESRVRADDMARVAQQLGRPVLVGEWHFGALDVGLPASGIGHVRTQEDRGRAYRVYLEDAAARPWCVGVHYFIMYDQSALGRFDGECYNIGFYDVCHRPYAPLCAAARASHERMYAVARGEVVPFADAPEYLPKLFL